MARPYRLQAEGCLYHITSRGNGRKKIYQSDRDYQQFIGYVKKAKEKFKFYLYAYVLMSNHYHLLLETTQANLSRIMHYINSAYTTYHNIKHKQSGHLFQGRYKSIVVDVDSYLLELSRYIHLNPLRAKMTVEPGGYRWTSYHEYMGKKAEEVIDVQQMRNYISINRQEYKQFVMEGIGKRSKIFENVYGGFILGRRDFIKAKLDELKEQIEGEDISYRRELIGVEIGDIVEEVARRYKKETEQLYGAKKKSMEAKKVAVYLCKMITGYTNKEIGNAFGITYSAVCKAANEAEKIINEDKGVRRKTEEIISHFKG